METKAVGGSENAGGFGQDTLGELGRLLGPSFGFFDDLLSPGGGRLGGAREDLINRSFDRGQNQLASRFGSVGGNSFGSGAATAATRLESERGPKLIEGIGQLQLGGLSQLLPLIGGLAGKDIPQRQMVQQQGGFGQALGLLAPALGAAFGPGGLLAGSAFGGLFGGGGGGGGFGGLSGGGGFLDNFNPIGGNLLPPGSRGGGGFGITPGTFGGINSASSNLPNLDFLNG